jgi:hypothetical protein
VGPYLRLHTSRVKCADTASSTARAPPQLAKWWDIQP